ncbi:MAG: putative Integrase family protein [Sphingomonas bacterium]|uniref:site-specific integrase n=1 Tax=Sphingomonas bacterium TaxID=1895847 RepID=UPI0026120053|nr:site-specific integrase [Sphingomonas bacterium]MDB5706604.1 putative Integrase family protein [Sphingomonas bacterium]
MPTMLLTDIAVRALKGSSKNEKFFDTKTPGFGVRCGIRTKTWVVMRGRNRELVTIGRYPDLSLADARTEAKKLLSATPEAKGISKTWEQARDEFLTENYKGSKSRWPHLVKLKLKNHFKGLDKRQLADIDDTDISAVLDKLKKTPSAQLHAYRAARTFLKWCTRPPRKWIKHSPMEGYEPPSKDKKGTRTLTDEELKAVWYASEMGSRQVFQLMVLWGTRNEETAVIRREWVVEGVLTIPGEFTKNGRDHAIPLLPLAQSILDSRPDAGPYFFQGRHTNERSLTTWGLPRLAREVKAETDTSGWQLRDIRRTFRSNMARLKVPREIAEVLINHAPETLDEIYDRYDRLDEKREALAKYEAFMIKLLGLGSTEARESP